MSTNQFHIQRIARPARFYAAHADDLHTVGADAFGQPIEGFAPQVKERFNKAAFGQAMYDGDNLVGFGLYDVLRGSHWRAYIY